MYGWEYVDQLIQGCRNIKAGGAATTKPVIDDMVDAILNKHPKARYLIHGTNRMFDKYAVSIYLLYGKF